MYLGRWEIDDLLVFACNTHTPSTGAAVDADSAPTYRVYEDETGTAILTGTMALLDDANTVGQYSEQITLSAANGFELGKSYSIRISGAVGGVAGATLRSFQVEGDAYTRIGADGAGLTAAAGLAAADVTTLLSRLSAARAGYLDVLAGWTGTLRQALRALATKAAGEASSDLTGGSSTYDLTTDSPEAIRDRGDAAWGASGLEAIEGELEAIGDTLDDIESTLEERTVYATGSEPDGTAVLTIRRGDTVAVEVGDLADLVAGWDTLWLTIKADPESDADSASILQVQLDAADDPDPGLVYLNGQAVADIDGVDADDAWISDVDTAAKTIQLNLAPAASRLLTPQGGLGWDVQMLRDGDITSLTTGNRTARVLADVTRAVE